METETVTRKRGTPVVSPYSTQATDLSWTTPTELAITTVAPPEPRVSTEPLEDARHSVVVGWTLYLPSGSDVQPDDRMEVRGQDFPVDGEPAEWGMGLVVQTLRTEG